MSYSQLYMNARGLAGFFSQRGLQKGDIVVLDLTEVLPLIELFWACSISGIIAFPVNTRFPKPTLRGMIEALKPGLVISDRGLTSDSLKYADLDHTQVAIDSKMWQPDLPATFLMTSGSSAQSKIVVHSHQNHMASAFGSNLNIPVELDDRWMLTLPLYHVGGLSILYRTILAGAAVVFPSSRQTYLTDIEKHQITHISLVATQFQRLIQEPGAIDILKQVKAILLGGSAIPDSLIQDALGKDLPIHLSYGSTEMASQICTTAEADRATGLKHSGRLLAGRDLIISHEGEIHVRGETLALGYRNGSETIDLRDDEGWFHSGDVGYLDVNGALTVLGRMDNQFISGGENIQPEYIETTLMQMEGIQQALVLPQADAEFGMRPVAYLSMDENGPSAGEMNEEVRRSLPGYMVPVSYYSLPELPEAGDLKISRHELAEYLADSNKHLHTIK
ncbi:MAG: o-succinylbenzoate--CoA ligase [Candidatus Marinimicrobia bacterium]|nr:o-succinylbenzoate--CoA ligase [Candidatus Neomarinimicrobiota bacterium]MCF7850517.1 o-succinylbenzoate--CoA ligase [Candidatus Neomarinimicrobiota bacterium]MCF7903970.1 o-succinylbenzoate--CoA ligase [Candidatus Neomarinimicrobiota bacterium]